VGIEAGEEARPKFLRVLFHDLATPLSAVSLHLAAARRKARKGEDAENSLEVAATELARAFDLFEKGRDLLLRERGREETFAFDPWVEETASRFGEAVQIEGETGGLVRADPSALSEALTALISNAREASSGRPVTVARERGETGLRARVVNEGRLPEGDVEKLFAPRTPGAARGWGMGLARARLNAAGAGGCVLLRQENDRVCAILEIPEEPAR
jgi:signal transduction histidine kinase